MGFGSGNFVFLRPCQDWGENRKGRTGTREKEIGFERERGRYPGFQNRDVHALRCGSMNPISGVRDSDPDFVFWGHRDVGGRNDVFESTPIMGNGEGQKL